MLLFCLCIRASLFLNCVLMFLLQLFQTCSPLLLNCVSRVSSKTMHNSMFWVTWGHDISTLQSQVFSSSVSHSQAVYSLKHYNVMNSTPQQLMVISENGQKFAHQSVIIHIKLINEIFQNLPKWAQSPKIQYQLSYPKPTVYVCCKVSFLILHPSFTVYTKNYILKAS